MSENQNFASVPQPHHGARFFAAANSRAGFFNGYGAVFDALRRLYIIKGGPGTGKSRFMECVAAEAESLGYTVERIYCSSDPDSLDGVVIRELDTGLADGTAPHVLEAYRPGFRDELVNLGDFWKSEQLAADTAVIERLNEEKSACYARAYRLLGTAGEFDDLLDELLAPAILTDKLRKAARGFARRIPAGSADGITLRFTDAMSMKGLCHLPTLEESASDLIKLEDRAGIAHFVYAAYAEALLPRQRLLESRSPLHPAQMDGLLLPEIGLALVSDTHCAGKTPARTLHTRRFLDSDALASTRQLRRFCVKSRTALLKEACGALEEARNAHFALEELYSAAMNFRKKEEFTNKFITRLFKKK